MSNRPHYLSLDALRGAAAIAVLLVHRAQWVPGGRMLPQASLAVDFFFMLSGFVIAAAYEQKLLGGMTLRAFARVRLIRLYPMIVLGAVLGASYLAFKAVFWNGGQGLWEVAFQLPFAVLALPAPPVSPLVYEPFLINGPTWSLFFELLANLMFVLLVRVLRWQVIVAIILISLAVLMWPALTLPKFPRQLFFSTLPEHLPRTILPYFIGVLLFRAHRAGRLPRIAAGPIVLSMALIAFVAVPHLGRLDTAYYFLAVLVVFPLLIIAGIGAEPAGWQAKVAAFGGALSYPLYIVHMPVYLWFAVLTGNVSWTGEGGSWPYYLAAIATCMTVAMLALWFYDQPVRRWLSGKSRASQT